MALGGYLEDALGYPERNRVEITTTLADSYLHVRLLPHSPVTTLLAVTQDAQTLE
jgi:hypothetical protein